MAKRFSCELISWQNVYRLCRKVSLTILDQDQDYNFIVAIGRGGYVPARIISDYLDISDLTSFKIEHYIKGAEKQEQAIIRFPLNADIRGKKVLLVDDVSDTGDTLKLASDYLLEHKPGILSTVVMHHKQSSTFTPDYWGKRVVKWRWIIYPWALMEDLTGFLIGMKPAPKDMEMAQEQLYKLYGIRPPKHILEDAWMLYQRSLSSAQR